ncbi:MAG: hypothetical protein C0621_04965 [Desulfuromonas sp.]|nr:MAG: hypothetical protein C0621_04965 [Desulfuromonas sp.]
MFTVTRFGPDRLDIEMSGKLDIEGMKTALDELLRNAEGIEHGKMLYDVIDYHLPTLPAIVLELSRVPEMIEFIRKFDRAAVLADKPWLRTVSEVKGLLIPKLEIKAFDREQKEEAVAWLEREDV